MKGQAVAKVLANEAFRVRRESGGPRDPDRGSTSRVEPEADRTTPRVAGQTAWCHHGDEIWWGSVLLSEEILLPLSPDKRPSLSGDIRVE